MNQLNLLKEEHLNDSNSVLEELIDHIGDLLAEEYFQIMEDESSRKQYNENE